MRKRMQRYLTAVIFTVPIWNLSCALYTPSTADIPVVTTCSIPTDQSGTISGRWTTHPIPIAFHQNDWSAAEISAIASGGADTWNKFFNSSKQFPILDYGGSVTAPTVTNAVNPTQNGALCATGLVQNGAFTGPVGIYKLAKWPSAYAATTMALTSFCTNPDTTYPKMYMAVIEVNYQNYFTTAKVPDLETIVKHEMGHLLGLNHSCTVSGQAGFPDCNSSTISQDYLNALMIPSFGFDASGAGQQVRQLGTNDQNRANCLY